MATATSSTTTGAENIHWNLADLYAGDDTVASVSADLKRADEMAQQLAADLRGRVSRLDADGLVAALRRMEEIHELQGRAATFAFLQFATDMADPARGALLQKVQEAISQTGTHLVFFSLEWIAVPDGDAERLLSEPPLANYVHHLQSARRYKPYVLTEPEEKILVEKSVTARSSWDRLFDELTGSIRVRQGDGEKGLDEALAALHSPDPEERRRLAEAVTEALRADVRTRRFVLNTVLADKAIDDRLRQFPAWVSDRNLANEASDEAVQSLITAVTGRYEIPHRYYALKKKLLGLEHFYDWDRYAPYGTAEPEVPWEEARDTVLEAYGSFSPKLRGLAQEFFDKNWIDAALAPNKQGGAFSHPAVPSAHPYVLLNYTGRRRDVLVMAHELGHGVHQSLARRQTPLNADTPLTTAETASIFGETVTFARLLERESDPARRLSLLVGRIDDATATIFRQVAMNRFEDAIHTHRRANGELSEDDLSGYWLKTQREMLGPAVEVSDHYGVWWSYVHHFIAVPGYVYAYAFGNLLALAIYARVEEEGPAFAPKYFELLEAGGSDTPEALTSRVGVDLADPAFWNRGLDTLSKLIDEAEQLGQQLG
ncbi:MAG TPA: M3 family oligoendopeptidase [Candidatus Dormibacteraeota bacterium]|nr:M3 family oligoendopeptidase [Candidatus Dormibacteraeota bacterium]